MTELLIWVDEKDKEVGCGTKEETHKEEKLHRAFSVFVYNLNNNKMLIHRRAKGKYHSGGLWTNSCCSHPSIGERTVDAAYRRLKEELGLEVNEILQELGSFQYYQKYTDCAEHEIDHVFYLPIHSKCVDIRPDPDEISGIQWISIKELKDWLLKRPQDFTAWFPKAFEIVMESGVIKENGEQSICSVI